MEEYMHSYYHSEVTAMLSESVPELLGRADATDEWVHPETAKANFINIQSYNQFIDPSCVFLVGRIGTGKTAMLNKLKYSVEKGENSSYSDVIMIDTRAYIAELGKAIRLSQIAELKYSEIEHTAHKEWEKVLYTLAMKHLYSKYSEEVPKEYENIKKYLVEQGIGSSTLSVSKTLIYLSEKLGTVDSLQGQGLSAAAMVLGKITSSTYDKAMEEFNTILNKHQKLLILVDSIEKYEFDDTIILAILNALVNLCLHFDRTSVNISIKMAAPSELIPKLTAINPEKISSKIVYVRWPYKDLKTFIAVRLYKYLNRIDGGESVDPDMANQLFDTYYEKVCMTRCDFVFPTFPYCMSYTHKEPRQILAIFNAWLHYEKTYPDKPRMDLVTNAIQHDEMLRVKGALSIYSSIHHRMYEMFERTFSRRKYCFCEAEFDEWLNECSSMRGELDAYDLKRYFVSSGLVGTMVELHVVEPNNEQFQNKEMIRIKEVLFEYQYKECLPFNSGTKFCLHPMVFAALNIEVDKNTLVYPKPLEDEAEFIPWKVS